MRGILFLHFNINAARKQKMELTKSLWHIISVCETCVGGEKVELKKR